MKEQPDNGADAPADDRSMLSSAFDEAENPKPVETTAPDSEAQDGTRARDEAGASPKRRSRTVQRRQRRLTLRRKPRNSSRLPTGSRLQHNRPLRRDRLPDGPFLQRPHLMQTPPAVKEAIAKRGIEVNQGFQKLADYKGLDQFVDMARQNGKDLVKFSTPIRRLRKS